MEIDTSAFTEEAYELLSELEDSLLVLEENPQDMELIGRVFRAMHTIKGSGAMFGFDEVAEFTHDVETVFDKAREGAIPVTKELIDLTLAARDQIRAILDEAGGGAPSDKQNAQRIILGLRALIPGNTARAPQPANEEPEPIEASSESAAGKHTYRVRFKPDANIFMSGTNPLLLIEELIELGSCKVVGITDALPPLSEINPEQCHTSWEIFLTTDQGESAIQDVFIFVEDECELNIRRIDRDEDVDDQAQIKRLGDLLVERGDIDKQTLESITDPLGDRLVKAGLVSKGKVDAALIEQQVVKEKQQTNKVQEQAASVRVPSDKLDQLVDLVGELVTVQARLNQTAHSHGDHDLQLIAEEVERLTAELRDNTMSIRMLAIGTTFNKFKRLVRDLSKELGKQIELTTAGAETELDKNVIDQLNDPLVHIIRNSIDHGVESPQQRQAVGKPAAGTVHLSAEHSGANVLIRITDDGAGLDPKKLRTKAVEKGQLPADNELTDKEAYQLIFGAGFSTAAKITNVSGRGVGMDVVRKSIDSLRGSVEVDSTLGQGTSITLKLPLTLAIIEGLLVQIHDEYFVLPLAAVEECVELTRTDVANTHGRQVINVRGHIVPYIRLRDRFEISGPAPDVEQIVISEVEGQQMGFVVDHVIGQHQTVIKSLGKGFKHPDEFSGATILGNGTVALIIDLSKIVRLAEQHEMTGTNG
ncbi:CheA signal transduction histidine kinase [Magnetococcus marinus MC-1]|uniref:Chemotaxis protein CheA n=1 Tax=Magnetococcus marinus (strain ATCC BAA-1437 / JCM 17883 / MC-1) TaxID=156889 RepID=A0L5A8_MAGMM|nr:chemotaxis protein CheA [Magnetococcus marinus]ABK43151.1 CheA signal transduction histidine kinase [Magnetococcus marinus MC-1]